MMRDLCYSKNYAKRALSCSQLRDKALIIFAKYYLQNILIF
ncbi:hypothetical protein HMPREF3216_00905 [Gardnerella vaginalis]|uniref:Uncharacterized protein n=1 Tax=Gardnerella vaginalis TaxID=2702 RepID=A0A133NP95_GARVA|nr:hypothetical protein HMPREF3216_00905 [Gardnerella vaginalis]